MNDVQFGGEFMSKVVRIIKIARIKKCISQEELCRITGVGRATISKIENGNISGVRFGVLKAIAMELNLSAEEFFSL